MLVNAVHGESVEHIEGTHPLGVTLSQIVVDGHHVNTITRQGIEEDGEGSHQRLTFTGSHLGNLTLVQYDTAEELYIVVYHLPFQVVAASRPVVMIDGLVAIDGDKVFLGVGSQFAVEIGSRHNGLLVLGEAASRLLHDAEHLGHHLVEGYLIDVEGFLLQLVDFGKYLGTLVDGRVLDGCLQSVNLFFLRLG